jgi:hypothetical protein
LTSLRYVRLRYRGTTGAIYRELTIFHRSLA